MVALLVVVALAVAGVVADRHAGPTAAAGSSAGETEGPPAVAPAGAPDVVLVVTDDQRVWSLAQMPHVQQLLVSRGTTYTRSMVPTALCCPARASLLTGDYAHDHGVWSNSRPTGSWWRFHENGDEDRTIAVRLQGLGYRTALIGKYFNSFGNWAPKGYRPPGWDVFTAFRTRHRSGAYYDYPLSDGTRHGSDASDYSTDVIAGRAVDVVRSTPAGEPLFLYVAPYAPHEPATPAPRDLGAWAGRLPPFSSPALEDDVSDKPRWVQALPPVPVARAQELAQQQQEALMAVDDVVARLVAALEETGRLSNTLFVFTSDNGVAWGEHRVLFKAVPYAPATEVPLVVRWDGHVAAGATDDRLAVNVDIPTTIARVAGTDLAADGEDLLQPPRRHGFVLEAAPEPRLARPAYCGWRTAHWMFVHYATGEEELYDERLDPDELTNVIGDPHYWPVADALRERARSQCDPTPPDFSWD